MTKDSTPHQDDPTYRLTYRSHDLIRPAERKIALGALFTQARSNNNALGLTGALLLSGDWFVQTLEGEEHVVRSLFARIEHDPRHDRVELLTAQVVPERVFGRWSMARISEGQDHDIPLIAHVDGIAAAAGRPLTDPQRDVLAHMRSCAAAVTQGATS